MFINTLLSLFKAVINLLINCPTINSRMAYLICSTDTLSKNILRESLNYFVYLGYGFNAYKQQTICVQFSGSRLFCWLNAIDADLDTYRPIHRNTLYRRQLL